MADALSMAKALSIAMTWPAPHCEAGPASHAIQTPISSGSPRRWALLDWRQDRGALLLDEKYHEFRWFCLARVPTNGMNIVRAFIKGLSRR